MPLVEALNSTGEAYSAIFELISLIFAVSMRYGHKHLLPVLFDNRKSHMVIKSMNSYDFQRTCGPWAILCFINGLNNNNNDIFTAILCHFSLYWTS